MEYMITGQKTPPFFFNKSTPFFSQNVPTYNGIYESILLMLFLYFNKDIALQC